MGLQGQRSQRGEIGSLRLGGCEVTAETEWRTRGATSVSDATLVIH